MTIVDDFFTHFSPIFTKPAFKYFKEFIIGFTTIVNIKGITDIIKASQLECHFSNFYDFLKRYRWDIDMFIQYLANWIFQHIYSQPPDGEFIQIPLVIDDTGVSKEHARHMFGLCWHPEHHNKIKLTKKTESGGEVSLEGVTGGRGHRWVMLGCLWKWGQDQWTCLMLSSALFVREKYCTDENPYQSKLDLALQLVKCIQWPTWFNVLLVGDNFYGNKTIANELDCHILSHLKSNAVAFYPPPVHQGQRGRPRKYGDKVQLKSFLNTSNRLVPHQLVVYGKEQLIQIASFKGLLKGHKRPVKIILVNGLRKEGFLLFTTDLSLSDTKMVELYAARFQIEIAFRELKQEMAVKQYHVKHEESILRYVHLSLASYTLLKMMCFQQAKSIQHFPWYERKGFPTIREMKGLLSQKRQAQRIFRNLHKKGFIQENIPIPDDYWTLAS